MVGRIGVCARVCISIINRTGTRIADPVRSVIQHLKRSLSLLMGGGMVPLHVLRRVHASAHVPTTSADPDGRKSGVIELKVFAEVSCFFIGAPTLHGRCHWTGITKRTGEDADTSTAPLMRHHSFGWWKRRNSSLSSSSSS